MSLGDVLDQVISKSIETPKPAAAKPAPEPEGNDDAEEAQESEESEESEDEERSVVDEVEEEMAAEAEGDESEEEALSSKFKDDQAGKPEPKPVLRMEKIIEDGVERDISIDELKKGYQKASVSGKRFDEAAKMLKESQAVNAEVEDFVELFSYNPIAAGNELIGEDRMEAFLEKYYEERKAFEQMSPVEKENFILRKNQEMRDIKAHFKNNKQNEQLSETEAQAIKENLTQKVDKVILEAGFKTNEMKIRLLNKMKSYARQKPPGTPLELSEIEMLADRVKDETKGELSQIVEGMSDDELFEYLGSRVVEKVRKKLLEKYKVKKAQKVVPTKKIESKKPSNGPKNQNDYQSFWKNPS